MPGRQAVARQVGIAHDRVQQIVETVGDAAGEPTDSFQPLGLHELRFEVLAITYIATDSDTVVAALLPDRRRLQFDPAPGAVAMAHAIGDVRLAASCKLLILFDHA